MISLKSALGLLLVTTLFGCSSMSAPERLAETERLQDMSCEDLRVEILRAETRSLIQLIQETQQANGCEVTTMAELDKLGAPHYGDGLHRKNPKGTRSGDIRRVNTRPAGDGP